jgi:putative transposase
LARACGTARFAYNWALAEWNRQYAAGQKPTANALNKQWNAIKPTWVRESPKDANQRPFLNLQHAFTRFFKHQGRHPTFKRKGQRDAFYCSNDQCKLGGNSIRLPRIGAVKLAEPLRFNGRVMSVVVSRQADRWFCSVAVETEVKRQRTGDGIVGVDLGLKHFAVLSTGEIIDSPKPLAKALTKLRRANKALARSQRASKNRQRAQMKLARLHLKISDTRNDFLHKVTTKLCRENQAVVVEDLAVGNMMKNRKLARAISDAGWGEFKRQLEYKGPMFGTVILSAPRFYPSSKTCSACGAIKPNLALTERTFACPGCGARLDRDLNAAKNLYTLGFRGLQACGLGVSLMGAAEVEAGTKPRVAASQL